MDRFAFCLLHQLCTVLSDSSPFDVIWLPCVPPGPSFSGYDDASSDNSSADAANPSAAGPEPSAAPGSPPAAAGPHVTAGNVHRTLASQTFTTNLLQIQISNNAVFFVTDFHSHVARCVSSAAATPRVLQKAAGTAPPPAPTAAAAAAAAACGQQAE